jgi:zinc finger protein
VVRAETASIEFVELELELPSSRGALSTIEGIIDTVIEDLGLGQEERKVSNLAVLLESDRDARNQVECQPRSIQQD